MANSSFNGYLFFYHGTEKNYDTHTSEESFYLKFLKENEMIYSTENHIIFYDFYKKEIIKSIYIYFNLKGGQDTIGKISHNLIGVSYESKICLIDVNTWNCEYYWDLWWKTFT